jgi:hypothetical protein
MEKTLKKISVLEQHPDKMSFNQLFDWLSMLHKLEGVSIDDINVMTYLLSPDDEENGEFLLYIDDVAVMTFTITQTYPGSREYLVTSVTKYFK